ncbi:hypothetical protein C0Q70_10432 [Pomacea canaliculata]|uniref:Uncharacterized protein n=1 Tax=Pomacea canaliculata TaxID=400727 RepID=A0A2T7PCK8_POMCA|nr:hypothetical protein C0Q70_10432 [Pomacea canaliculata]
MITNHYLESIATSRLDHFISSQQMALGPACIRMFGSNTQREGAGILSQLYSQRRDIKSRADTSFIIFGNSILYPSAVRLAWGPGGGEGLHLEWREEGMLTANTRLAREQTCENERGSSPQHEAKHLSHGSPRPR